MEIFELRYFLAVAQLENVNRAAERIHVSPGSLSKAVARLEDELQTPLFSRSGRGIRLTPEGRLLKVRAARILQLEEDARFELKGKDAGSLNISVAAEEILLAGFGPKIAARIAGLFPTARTHFLTSPEDQAIEQVRDGDVHLALVTREPPAGMASKVLARIEFRTCASKKHPLLKRSAGAPIPLERILEHPFVSPDTAILGRIPKSIGTDGWRDDRFPRRIAYKARGLKLIENLVRDGLALGYLPDHFIESAGLEAIRVTDCPFSCRQTVHLVAKDPDSLGWLGRLWDRLGRE